RAEPCAADERLDDGGLDVAVDVELLDGNRLLRIERLRDLVGQAERGDEARDRALLFGIERTVGYEYCAEETDGERAEPLDALDVFVTRLRGEERTDAARTGLERDLLLDDGRHGHPHRRMDRRHRARHLD